MNGKLKYLNLLVLLTFLVGQVQYAYASYFCTMKNAPVSSSSMLMSMDDCNDMACNGSGTFAQPEQVGQTVHGDCMQMRLSEKSTVDNFTSADKSISHFIGIVAFLSVHNGAGNDTQTLAISHQLFNQTNSPPLDLPTLNSNLRI